jgi:hypothetical protein
MTNSMDNLNNIDNNNNINNIMPPSTASPVFIESIGLDPVRFCKWRADFTACDRATNNSVNVWSGILQEYMCHYLYFIRPPLTSTLPHLDPDFDRDAALLLLASEGGLTHAAAENIVRHQERFWDDYDHDHQGRNEHYYFGHFMPYQLAMAYVENMLCALTLPTA